MLFCGIDYGSKLAGTTVLSSFDTEKGRVQLQKSAKKQDADRWLAELLSNGNPAFVFIDAPLSLPEVYTKETISSPDFFYRRGDRLAEAMSPMFLGGLTARAMRLRYLLRPLLFYETYPAWQARRLELDKLHYKKELVYITSVLEAFLGHYPMFEPPVQPVDWHEIDALLALAGAYRFWKNEHEVLGDEEEGAIYV